MVEKLVPDTSVIVDGRFAGLIRKLLEEGKEVEVIVPEVVIAELQHQANRGREIGFDGLSELAELRKLAEKEERLKFTIEERKVEAEDIKQAKLGRLDELIMEVAAKEDATLVTGDRVQALVAEVRGVKTLYTAPEPSELLMPRVLSYFDDRTMSIHLKEGAKPMAKRGSVGDFKLVEVGEELSRDELEAYAREIVEFAHADEKSSIEFERRGVTIVQLREYRIIIARPPFSDGLEITAVRPLVKLRLEDYNLPKKLLERLEKGAEGILIAGPPGAGKTTFAQALAEFYFSKGKVVKTMECPRDLQLPEAITQYAPLGEGMEGTADVIVLTRPDYTIYDEVRKTDDFKVFADLRLAGIGLVGVTHATRPIDAIQRLIGRVELGMIPHVVDTVIFIERGVVRKAYELRIAVKVPWGMRDVELTRPVVEVRDFETAEVEYELYSYGEEVVVMPVKKAKKFAKPLVSTTKKSVILHCKGMGGKEVGILIDGELVCSARATKGGSVKVKQSSKAGRLLLEALRKGKEIEVTPL